MELSNDFRVPIPVDEAWKILTDVERIAPCMPGADLEEVAGEEYRGVVRVKVGPITAQYKGKATFLERDEGNHKVVLRAEGRETRGQGNANATITATLAADGDGTQVEVITDLTITGKVAQFGRGVLADVSAKLLNQFVECLEADVLSGAPEPAAAPSAPAAPAAPAAPNTTAEGNGQEPSVRRLNPQPSAPVDLMSTAGAPVAKRAAPLVAILFLLVWLLRRRRKARA